MSIAAGQSSATRQMFVAGAWAGAASGETFTAESPATGEAIGEVPLGSRDDAARAIAAANDAATAWSRTTAFERAALRPRVGDGIESRRDDLAHVLTLDQGKPLHESRDEVEELVAYWRNAAEDGKRLEGRLANSFTPGKRVLLIRRPRGVIGVITPWNWPYTMPAELIAPALASGNTVVWTPATTTAVCSVALAGCVVEAAPPPSVQPRPGPRRARRRRNRRQPGHAWRRLHRLDGDRPQGRGRRGR